MEGFLISALHSRHRAEDEDEEEDGEGFGGEWECAGPGMSE